MSYIIFDPTHGWPIKLALPINHSSRNGIPLKVTKSANADNIVRQASSANDHISAYAHATERNRKTLSGSQTQ
ncbi:hypothetical protein PIROE2DRAFT_4394 [Piromyces sp. E2]|nr:hypothetical protein PIROE2DRAFT_4394 [Piromyces sp. E2]|eukprot:OUM67979.1 hypothetical protein PIROE2DRAFT_4394 [Piromyces sp. E2]